jgi:hypothetical protein
MSFRKRLSMAVCVFMALGLLRPTAAQTSDPLNEDGIRSANGGIAPLKSETLRHFGQS